MFFWLFNILRVFTSNMIGLCGPNVSPHQWIKDNQWVNWRLIRTTLVEDKNQNRNQRAKARTNATKADSQPALFTFCGPDFLCWVIQSSTRCFSIRFDRSASFSLSSKSFEKQYEHLRPHCIDKMDCHQYNGLNETL